MIGAALGSALIGASSARKAAKAQSKAADQQYQLQKEMFDQTREDLSGYRDGGELARQAYLYEMGLGAAPVIGGTAPRIETIASPDIAAGPLTSGANGFWNKAAGNIISRLTPNSGPTYRVGGKDFASLQEAEAWANANKTGGTTYGGFKATPGYEFRVDQGNDSINALAGMRGGLVSGRTLEDLASFNQNIASEEYGGYMNRLAGLTDMGATAAAGQASANNAFASGGAGALANKGNAAAAGAAGVGNALQQGISNGIGILGYQNGLNQQNGFTPQYSGWRA